MRKMLSITLATLLLATSAAHADYYYPRGHYHGGGGGGNWAAPLVGGLIIGGMLGSMASQPRYYDDGFHTECRREQIFDRYGNFIGYERRCYRVPND